MIIRNHSRLFKVLAVVVTMILLMSTVPFSIVYAVDVSTASALQSAINNGSEINLKADITLTSWTTANYSGILHGNGHVITTPKPLINTLSGSVEDLGVIAADNFSGNAILANTVNANQKGILNTFVYGKFSTSSTGVVGGMVGTLTNGYVENSFACVDITANNATYVGGLIGKIDGGGAMLANCYSAGALSVAYKNYNICRIAGLANMDVTNTGHNVLSTYSSCQLREINSRAKPSGVNGLYDNQMSIVRENPNNLGVTTRELMSTNLLSDAFAVTGNAYPSLKVFAEDQWGDKADAVVRVSTAAVAFEDVDSASRYEPAGFKARADYLTLNTKADRTNGFDLEWNLNATSAKVYDTVPLTSASDSVITEVGTANDLLHSEFVFATADTSATLTATSGVAQRVWYLNANTKNPYFNSGTGNAAAQSSSGKDDPFTITTIPHLNAVRHYGLIGSYQYKVTSNLNFSGSNFDPIVDFAGNFNGGSKEIQNIVLTNAGNLTNVGVFANIRGATIRYTTVKNATVTAQTNLSPVMGVLIGTAESNSQVYRNIIIGSGTKLTNNFDSPATGGLIGVANNASVRGNLVSASIIGGHNCGGLVGELTGSKTMYENGSTGYIIGNTHLGGLVGKSTSTPVNNCYSTMAVLSDASGAVNIGGLIGYNGGTLTKSYASSLVYAKIGTGVGPLVGAGTAATSSYSGVGASMIGTSVMPNLTATTKTVYEGDSGGEDWSWTKTDTHMPQITYFVHTDRYAALSLISTTPVYFQKYWSEAVADNMTTGWIDDSFSISFSKMTDFSKKTYSTVKRTASLAVVSSSTADEFAEFIDSYANTYTVSSGHGFEAPSSVNAVGLMLKDSNSTAIRVVGALRPKMHSLRYTVQGTAGTDVYVEVGFASAKNGTYQSYQTMHTIKSTAAENGSVQYDMPSASYVRVKVVTCDDYKVLGNILKFADGTALTYDANTGYYYSSAALSTDTTVNITLTKTTPPWGLRQQTY